MASEVLFISLTENDKACHYIIPWQASYDELNHERLNTRKLKKNSYQSYPFYQPQPKLHT